MSELGGITDRKGGYVSGRSYGGDSIFEERSIGSNCKMSSAGGLDGHKTDTAADVDSED